MSLKKARSTPSGQRENSGKQSISMWMSTKRKLRFLRSADLFRFMKVGAGKVRNPDRLRGLELASRRITRL